MRGTLGRASFGFIGAVTLVAAGCATIRPYDPGPGKRVAASVPQSTYLSGGAVNVTISNLSDVSLSYPDGFCKTALQRQAGTGWITVSAPAVCPVSLGLLDPGQTVVYRYRLPSGVAVGIYRLTMPMPVPDEATAGEPELLTPAFKVEISSSQ